MNVTVSLPEDLVREAKHEAVDRGISLSRFLADLLEEHLSSRRRYVTAWQESRTLMNQGPLPVTEITWNRDDLHDG